MNKQRVAALIAFLHCCWPLAWSGANVQTSKRDAVILVHGLGRTRFSMKMLEWTLRRKGYWVINIAYPSTRVPVEEAAKDWLAPRVSEVSDAGARVHFVTHSLGGIVVRQYLKNHRLENPGRVAMLAPPNQGSELADAFRESKWYRCATGPAGQQLGCGASSLPNTLGPATFDTGIIAGDRSLNPRFSALIPGCDDGKVSVQRAALEGMKDFLIVHRSHTWMMWSKEVTQAVGRFLEEGKFAAE